SHLIDEPNIEMKRGWISVQQGIKYTSTFDLDKALTKNFAYADILGYWCRHLSYLLIGKHPFSIKDVRPKPRYVGDLASFKKLMSRIEALGSDDLVAVDTETLNLSARSN